MCEFLLTHVILLKKLQNSHRALSSDGALEPQGVEQLYFEVDGIYFAFSWQWREWCWENREYEVVVAAHNEPMQRPLTAGAADTSGGSLQDGA